MTKPKPKKGASRLERQVAAGYAAFLARRGLKPAGKWTAGYGRRRKEAA